MDRHPGGKEHSRYMIELMNLPEGAAILDMGAGAGETVGLLRVLGYNARGIDLQPRSDLVEQGDYLCAPYSNASFDGIISQCSFYVSGNVPGALAQAHRLLKKGGILVLSDVFPQDENPEEIVQKAGFETLQMEDMTESWKQHYIQLRWQGEISKLTCDRKVEYKLILCKKL